MCPPDLAGQGREADGAEEEHDEYEQTALVLVSQPPAALACVKLTTLALNKWIFSSVLAKVSQGQGQ